MSAQALLQSLKESILMPSERESHLRRTNLNPRQNDHTRCENNVWLRRRGGNWWCGRYQCSGRRRGRRGGVRAVPAGVIEISDQQTRFVPITDRKKLTGAVVAGIGLGIWLGWRRRR